MSDHGDDAIGEALALAQALPPDVVTAIFARYGKPLADAPPPLSPDERHLRLPAAVVRVLNVRTAVDVIGNDWFVLEADGADPLALAGPLFAAAVAALTESARKARR